MIIDTPANVEKNLADKLGGRSFVQDVAPLLRSGIKWDVGEAARIVSGALISEIPDDSWKAGNS